MTFAVHMAKIFDFVKAVDDTKVRELFGSLPEILEHRIKASWTKRNAPAMRWTTAPASELGQNQRGRSSADEGAGVKSSHESRGLPQVRAELDGRGVTNLNLPRQREYAARVHSEESPESLSMNVTQLEPPGHERRQGSSIVADRSSTRVLQHVSSEDCVVTDLDAPAEADERLERGPH